MRIFIAAVALSFAFAFTAAQLSDAPTGFDNKTNGMVDDATHQADQTKFDETEQLSDGLGPLYNAQSCRECHQNPVSGAASQVTELRVGHLGPDGHFRTPDIPIADGAEVISGRSLVNDRAICPNAAFPDRGNSGTRSRDGDDSRVSHFRESFGRRLRRGGFRSNADRAFQATVQVITWENLRAGSVCSHRGSARTDGGGALWLEGSARESPVVCRRRVSE